MSEHETHPEQKGYSPDRAARLQRLLKLGNESFIQELQNSKDAEQLLADLPISEITEHKDILTHYLEDVVPGVIDNMAVNAKTGQSIARLLAEDKAFHIAEQLYPREENESAEAAESRRRTRDVLLLSPEEFKDLVKTKEDIDVIDEAARLRDEEDEAHTLNAQFDSKKATDQVTQQAGDEAYRRNRHYDEASRRKSPVTTTQPQPSPEPQQATRLEANTESKEGLKVRARTFEEAESIKKIFRPETIMGMVNNKLEISPGENVASIKQWFDRQAVTPEENRFINDVEAVKAFHTQLSELVQNNIHIITSSYSEIKDNLGAKTEDFKNSLKQRDKTFGDKAAIFYAGGRPPEWKGLSNAANFKGLAVMTEYGLVALANRDDANKTGVRSNITFQEGLNGGFVHWETDVRAKRKADGAIGDKKSNGNFQKPAQFDRRIYLNPQNKVACKVFAEVMQALNEGGFEAHGKIYDRAAEALSSISDEESKRKTRSDAIVIYTTNKDADKILSLVLEKVETYKDAFQGRATPRITQRIYDGVAVGDEPIESGTSLTEQRANLANEVVKKVRADLGLIPGEEAAPALQDQVVELFNRYLPEVATSMDINPQNISFNAV